MTPLQRAARAARDADIEGRPWDRDQVVPHPSFDNLTHEADRERYWRIARAVLTAIREPGKMAINAGITAATDVEDWTQDSFDRYRVDDASDMPLPVWQAMIDAMLAEEPPAT